MRRIQNILSLSVLFLLILGLSGAALAQDAAPISFGDTVEGELTATQGFAEYTFTGEKGQFVNITLTSGVFDAFLRLNDPNGDEITTNDDGAGSLNARIGPFELPSNGKYTIIATSLSGSAAGSYTLTLGSTEISRIEYTQTVDGTLTAAEPAITYNFTGQSGDTIIINLSSNDFDAYLRLTGEDTGYDLMTNDDGGGSTNSQIGPYALPETGNYVITATSLSGTDIGSFTLSLGKITSKSITIGETLDAEMTGTEPLYFTFEGKAGQALNIRVNGDDTIDTRLRLRGPDGYDITSDDDSGGRIDPEIRNVIISQDGLYSVLVEPYSEAEIGPLSITISENELPSLDNEPQRLRLSDKQTQQVVTFTGVAGERVRLSFVLSTPDAVFSPSITITQAGSSLSYISSSTVNEVSFVLRVPADGKVTIQIDDYSYTPNVLTAALERLKDE